MFLVSDALQLSDSYSCVCLRKLNNLILPALIIPYFISFITVTDNDTCADNIMSKIWLKCLHFHISMPFVCLSEK